MENIFTKEDLNYINSRGISIDKIQRQFDFFKQGIPKINLVRSATVNDGIYSFTENEIDFFVDYFDKNKAHFNIEKFVPASGAATRMFKFLNEFLNEFDIENDMELMREMGVRAVPTIKIFKEGTEVFSRPGVMQPAEVLELLN
jgi:hypothetical protein